jgi:hypothetical protein
VLVKDDAETETPLQKLAFGIEFTVGVACTVKLKFETTPVHPKSEGIIAIVPTCGLVPLFVAV